MRRNRIAVVVVAALSAAPAGAQIVTEMTPATIAEAIAAGQADKKAGMHFLKTKGIVVGFFTTPFSRVASAAQHAKALYKPFSEADVTPDMTVPQLEVFAGSVAVSSPLPPGVGNVEAVLIMPKGAKDVSMAIHPAKTSEVSEEYKNLMGASLNGKSINAVFPLDVLKPGREIVVIYDRIVGHDYLSKCTECRVELDLKGVR
ncbi:MAG TPA: hypothetical protein VN461_12480 [Vicinamibacteria bacterium]|nr:hypothetical protein [Vicinamibacteria bacterium]